MNNLVPFTAKENISAKEKEISSTENEDEGDVELDRKRHLNVVFIGHVGK